MNKYRVIAVASVLAGGTAVAIPAAAAEPVRTPTARQQPARPVEKDVNFTTGKDFSFNRLARSAERRVHRRFPKAVLLEAFGTSPTGRTGNFRKIKRWRFVFRVKDGSAVVHSTRWNRFGKVHHIPSPYLGNQDLRLPLRTELSTATRLLKRAGHRTFVNVTVRYPVAPDFTEPYYIFELPSGAFMRVGSKTRRVRPIS